MALSEQVVGQLSAALRINTDLPSQVAIQMKTHQGSVEYQLYSLPFYLIAQMSRLLRIIN